MEKLSRRSFITKTGAVAAGTLILPGLVGCKTGKKFKNGKVNLAFIGQH